MDRSNLLRMALSIACFTLLCVLAVDQSQAAVTVSPGNMGDWAFQTTVGDPIPTADAIANFVEGPDSPPLGSGSAHFNTGTNGSQSAAIRSSAYDGFGLSGLTALSYDTYATSWNGQQVPFLSINIDSDNNGFADDLLFFEPAYQTPATGNDELPDQGSPLLNGWQSWNAFTGGWWANSGYFTPGTGVGSLADYILAFPSAVIRNDGVGAVRLGAGFGSDSDVFDSYVDAFTIGTGEIGTTFDFEAAADVPEPASLIVWSLLGLTITGGGWWRRRKVSA